jgi:hypothetical protein
LGVVKWENHFWYYRGEGKTVQGAASQEGSKEQGKRLGRKNGEVTAGLESPSQVISFLLLCTASPSFGLVKSPKPLGYSKANLKGPLEAVYSPIKSLRPRKGKSLVPWNIV